MHQKVYEVLVELPLKSGVASEVLKELIVGLGQTQENLIEQTIDGRTQIVFYCHNQRLANRYVAQLKKLKLKGLRIAHGVLYQDDWLTRWKKDWKPFALTSRVDVVPVWCKDQYKFGRRDYIFLDTISSFGTGLHETTRFMTQLIEKLKGKYTQCLDIGTGTGILALYALKTGAQTIKAVDLDPMCIEAASANFKANGYDPQSIQLADIGQWKAKETYDLVLANLVTFDLIRLKEKILSCVAKGGWLAVSGISLENLPQLKEAFSSLPLRCIKILKGKHWSAVLYKRQK